MRIGGRFTRGALGVLALFALTCAVAQVANIAPQLGIGRVLNVLVLHPRQALGTRPFQLLTAPLLQLSFLQLLFTGLLMYSVGSAVEQMLGTRRFLRLCVQASLLGALTAAGLGRLLDLAGGGLIDGNAPVLLEGSPVFMALLGAFAVLFGEHQATLFGMGRPLSVRMLSGFFIVLGIVIALLAGRPLEAAASLAAVLVGLRAGGVPLRLALRDLLGRARRRRAEAERRRFTVLSGGLPPRKARNPDDPENPRDRRWVN